MTRANFRVVANRPVSVPVLRQEFRTESTRTSVLRALKEFFDSITSAVLAGLGILALVYVVTVAMLSLRVM